MEHNLSNICLLIIKINIVYKLQFQIISDIIKMNFYIEIKKWIIKYPWYIYVFIEWRMSVDYPFPKNFSYAVKLCNKGNEIDNIEWPQWWLKNCYFWWKKQFYSIEFRTFLAWVTASSFQPTDDLPLWKA